MLLGTRFVADVEKSCYLDGFRVEIKLLTFLFERAKPKHSGGYPQ